MGTPILLGNSFGQEEVMQRVWVLLQQVNTGQSWSMTISCVLGGSAFLLTDLSDLEILSAVPELDILVSVTLCLWPAPPHSSGYSMQGPGPWAAGSAMWGVRRLPSYEYGKPIHILFVQCGLKIIIVFTTYKLAGWCSADLGISFRLQNERILETLNSVASDFVNTPLIGVCFSWVFLVQVHSCIFI